MFDLGESLWDALEADFEKRVELDLTAIGVNGDELSTGSVVVRLRGDGVKGIRPHAILVEKTWLLIGVDVAVAMLYGIENNSMSRMMRVREF